VSAPPPLQVAIPVHDAGPWLDAALRSIHQQRFEDWSAVVVDDGSTDDSPSIAAAWAARDPRFRLLRPGRVGLVAALNLAVQGESPLVARFDGDDLSHPERFARQTAFLAERPDVDLVDSRVEHFRDDGPVPGGMERYRRWQDAIATDEDFERELLVENPVCHPAVMLRRRTLQPYREGPFPEDYELWLRLKRAGARFHKLPDRLVRWRDRDDRLTRTGPAYSRTAFFVARWQHFTATVDVGALRIAVWGAAASGKPWIRALVEAGSPPVAVVDIDPKVLGRTRHGVQIIEPDELPSRRPELVLVAVGAAGARALIEERLAGMGLAFRAVAGLA
jgi:glycosyltransferase involved in cell wall biosynthesis